MSGILAALILLSAVGAHAVGPRLNGFNLEGSLVPAADIHRGGSPRDGIPALTDPRFVAAADAELSPEDRVIGVSLGGTAKAYPIRILNWHEVVNDALAGRRIAVTYCPLCGTAMVFDSNRKIYAAGDICSAFKFTHTADAATRLPRSSA